ncbi:MAG: trypsin-like peptidase domain-containing protein [Methylophilaceae bacterium]|nr:trypsin-like peptidase domain-containing protein [Methylophilaceae bacterium]
MKNILLFSALISAASSAFAYDKEALMQAYFGVVMIQGYNQEGGLAYGSGVVVGENKVITNCHVLRATKQPWVARGQDTYAITSVKADTWNDLCLAVTENLALKPVKLGKSMDLKRGEEVAGIGHSNGTPAPLTSTGYVNGLYAGSNHGVTANVIRTNAKFRMGASGSGLFDMNGQLVGINTFKTAGTLGSIHFAMPVEWIDVLEKQIEITVFPIKGKALWEEDEDKKPFYMQAAVPESRGDWVKLMQVAQKWTKAEPNSPDAWFALAVSEENLADIDTATQHYLKSASLDTQNMDVLIKLGELAKVRGDKAELNRVHAAIANIDPDIGQQYQQFVDCTSDC